jgi:hypothetical protein
VLTLSGPIADERTFMTTMALNGALSTKWLKRKKPSRRYGVISGSSFLFFIMHH